MSFSAVGTGTVFIQGPKSCIGGSEQEHTSPWIQAQFSTYRSIVRNLHHTCRVTHAPIPSAALHRALTVSRPSTFKGHMRLWRPVEGILSQPRYSPFLQCRASSRRDHTSAPLLGQGKPTVLPGEAEHAASPLEHTSAVLGWSSVLAPALRVLLHSTHAFLTGTGVGQATHIHTGDTQPTKGAG